MTTAKLRRVSKRGRIDPGFVQQLVEVLADRGYVFDDLRYVADPKGRLEDFSLAKAQWVGTWRRAAGKRWKASAKEVSTP